MSDSVLRLTSQAWLGNMWTACWQGGLLILTIWVVCRLFKKMDPGLRQGLWWLACLKFLIAVVWVRPIALPVLPTNTASFHQTFSSLAPVVSTTPLSQPAGAGEGAATYWAQSIVVLWALGVMVVLGLSVRSGIAARRMVIQSKPIDDQPLGQELRELAARLGLATVPRLMLSDEVSAPCVLGHLRPIMIVPQSFEEALTEEERRMALAHELAHLRRRDLWLALVPSFAFALFYFFPPIWLACREWATDREASCDQDALQATGARPRAYGEMLMKIAKGDHRRVIPGLGATRQFHSLKRRMAAMVDSPGSPRLRWLGIALLGAASVFIVPFSLAAPIKAGGILGNSGFEAGVTEPEGWIPVEHGGNFELAWDGSVAHLGRYSVRISRFENKYWPIAQWTHEVPYDGASQSIEFGAWIKAQKVGKAVLDVQFEHSDGKWSHGWAAFVGEMQPGYGFATHDWAPYSGVVRIPEGTKRIIVALQAYGPGTVWMDDAFAQYVSGPIADRDLPPARERR